MNHPENFHISLGDESISNQRLDLEWKAWPEFMHHDSNINALWSCLYRDLPNYQVVIYDGENIAGLFNTLPIHYVDPLSECLTKD